MADGTLYHLHVAPVMALHEHPQSNVGLYGYPAPDAPVIDQDGNRVMIRGRHYRTFMSTTNAIRCAAALQTLADLGSELPRVR